MTAIFWLIDTLLNLYFWLIIAYVIMNWLFVFNVINAYSPLVAIIRNFLQNMCEPIFYQVRRVIPLIGGIDLSPLVILLGISFLQIILRTSIAPLFNVGYY